MPGRVQDGRGATLEEVAVKPQSERVEDLNDLDLLPHLATHELP